MSHGCPKPCDGFGFSLQDIEQAVSRRGLLSMEIEFSLACNFRCPYCYVSEDGEPESLSDDEIHDVILQAKELGARSIIILGGEPMLHPAIKDQILFIREQGLAVEMFTNGTNMTAANARFMFDHDVAVVLKMNSFMPETQNRLAGRDTAYETIQTAYRNTRAAGYPAAGKRLAVSTIIAAANIDELPELWRHLRREGVEPYFEMITPQGSARQNEWLSVSVERQKQLFDTLADIDRTEFHRCWEPQPPLVGNRCLRHRFSCLVTAAGTVMPCVGITVPLGNIRQDSLRDILDRSEVIDHLRRFPETIKAPCGDCENASVCYGCRGAAYQLTGDYLAADPLCWRNADAMIERLPTDVERYVPQRSPMRLIDRLISMGERCGELEMTVPETGPFIAADGTLDEAAFIEIIAQAVAGLHGFQTPERQRAGWRGLLLGAKHVDIVGVARAGMTLSVLLRKTGKYGAFGIVHGTVSAAGRVLATGEVKVWQSRETAPEGVL